MLFDLALPICYVATVFIAGVVWFLQLNHYPLYKSVGREDFAVYIANHNRRLGLAVVLPAGLAMVSSALLALTAGTRVQTLLFSATVAVAGVILASTILVQGPAHARLEREGRSDAIIHRIIATNWIRTIGWTMNALILTVAIFGPHVGR